MLIGLRPAQQAQNATVTCTCTAMAAECNSSTLCMLNKNGDQVHVNNQLLSVTNCQRSEHQQAQRQLGGLGWWCQRKHLLPSPAWLAA